ncbi:MAG TPA: alkaline phosphatase [Thermoguttaceae bacterium]|nr:alkaline phosphatase [Thermoguttaceae bacterium]
MSFRDGRYWWRTAPRLRPGPSAGRRPRFEHLEPRRLLSGGTLENVILLIGDGMGFEQVNAARMFLGGEISFDRLPYRAEMTTFSADAEITDSAASATAMATGRKVDNNVVSLAIPGDGSELTTLLELATAAGKSTGLVTTTIMPHGTPSPFGAHAESRYDYYGIADDLLTQTKPDVMFSGGGYGMTVAGAAAAGYTVVTNRAGLLSLDPDLETRVAGLFGYTHLPYEFDGLGNLPHLTEMTAVALDVLDADPDGFFLMVEGGLIDYAGHANDIERAVGETVEFANAVQTVLAWAEGRTDTLVLVTADHECGGMTVLADNGPGNVPTVAWSSTSHTGVNVPLYAWGTNAHLVDGVLDNTGIFTLASVKDVRPLPPISLLELSGLDPSAETLWFRGRTTHQGWLTVEATVPGASDRLELTLYDEQLEEVGSAVFGAGNSRVDWQVDGPDTMYYLKVGGTAADVDLRLINLIELSPDGSRLTVYGTRGDDTFAAFSGSPQVSVNGIRYEFEGVTRLHFVGGGGADVALLAGSDDTEEVVFYPNSATVTGPALDVELTGVSTIQLDGGGTDVARLYDSPGNDYYVAAPAWAELTGNGFRSRVIGFENIYAYGTAGGSDLAKLFDSHRDDFFYATPTEATLYGQGFRHQVDHFEWIHAYASSGHDVAKLFDTPGDDVFLGDPIQGVMYGNGYYHRAKSFDEVHAYATAGNDLARLYDSAGDDTFEANSYQGALFGEGFYNRAKHFDEVHAYANAGGNDTALLHDSPGPDRFVATPYYATLYGNGFDNRASNFDVVRAYADVGGFDVAKLFDSPSDDRFDAAPASATLFGNGFSNQANRFDQVHAYATAGGTDIAKLFDSHRDDTFEATPTQGALFGPGYYNRAKQFDAVHAYSSRGFDVARLYDSPGNDIFATNAIQGALYGPGYYNRAKLFEEVYALSTAGGYDVVTMEDSDGIDLFEAEGNWARLSNSVLDFLYEATAFDRVRATATTEGDTAVVGVLEQGLVLDLNDLWQGL